MECYNINYLVNCHHGALCSQWKAVQWQHMHKWPSNAVWCKGHWMPPPPLGGKPPGHLFRHTKQGCGNGNCSSKASSKKAWNEPSSQLIKATSCIDERWHTTILIGIEEISHIFHYQMSSLSEDNNWESDEGSMKLIKKQWSLISKHRSLAANSLTAKSVPAGTKNSHKHPHHDRVVFPSSGMKFMDTPDWTRVTSSEGVGWECVGWV